MWPNGFKTYTAGPAGLEETGTHCEVCQVEIAPWRTVCCDCLQLYQAVRRATEAQLEWLRKLLDKPA
jgi:hypothetical protein